MGTYIQIGAGAGDLDPRANYRDGFSEFVKRQDRGTVERIILVEPNPANIPALTECWREFPQAEIFQVGICPSADQSGTATFHFAEEDGPHFQVFSMNEGHVRKHYPNARILSTTVDVMTLDEFFQRYVGRDQVVDLLALDIEGVDADVVLGIDWTRVRCNRLSLEHLHLGAARDVVRSLLEQAGFRYSGPGLDHNGFDWMYERVAAPGDAAKLPPVPAAINLGSGRSFDPLMLNIDIDGRWKPDLIVDLSGRLDATQVFETRRFGPLRLTPGSFASITAINVLESVGDLVTLMTNCLLLLRVGGEIRIKVSYDLSHGAWQDPTHVRTFNENSWLYYADWFWYLGWTEARFDIERLWFSYGPVGLRMAEAQQPQDVILRTPRAVDSMEVTLRKRALSEPERLHVDGYLAGSLPDHERGTGARGDGHATGHSTDGPGASGGRSTRPRAMRSARRRGGKLDIVVIFDSGLRPDTTGTYVVPALRRLGHNVTHYSPFDYSGNSARFRDYADLELDDVDFVLYVDDDISYPVVAADVPVLYWCIDTHRMENLVGGGTRWERIRACARSFLAQKDRADELGSPWLPLAYDPDAWNCQDIEKPLDWCFIGNLNPARIAFVDTVRAHFPNGFAGNAYGAEANRLYNSSRIALNLSYSNDINMRFFEAQATSALLLTNRVHNGEEALFRAAEYFENPAHCVERMHALLANPADLALRARAQAEDMLAHTYDARMGALIERSGL